MLGVVHVMMPAMLGVMMMIMMVTALAVVIGIACERGEGWQG